MEGWGRTALRLKRFEEGLLVSLCQMHLRGARGPQEAG